MSVWTTSSSGAFMKLPRPERMMLAENFPVPAVDQPWREWDEADDDEEQG